VGIIKCAEKISTIKGNSDARQHSVFFRFAVGEAKGDEA
jgi:hypothetical protein